MEKKILAPFLFYFWIFWVYENQESKRPTRSTARVHFGWKKSKEGNSKLERGGSRDRLLLFVYSNG